MHDLYPGDVLSYSAGSTQTGPDGFRKVRGGGNLLAPAARLFPELMSVLAGPPALLINAYPATTGTYAPGITVDSYMSPRIVSRALQLGAVEQRPVILAAQPLFAADALLRHIAAGFQLPASMLLCVGGYVLPRSLEQLLREELAPRLRALAILQLYGAAEVDAACLIGRDRDADGALLYHPRPDVEPSLLGEELLLTLRAADGAPVIEGFRTGDSARQTPRGWLIWNDRRLHPEVARELASWSVADWRRRTGYVRRDGETIWVQLRAGETPLTAQELEHFEFARRFGFSWLEKPNWR